MQRICEFTVLVTTPQDTTERVQAMKTDGKRSLYVILYNQHALTFFDRTVDYHHERESWRCAVCALDDVSINATDDAVADKEHRQSTICRCKEEHHLRNDKSEGYEGSRCPTNLLKTVLGPVKAPLTLALAYIPSGRPSQLGRRLIDSIKSAEDLLATGIDLLVLEAFASCAKGSLEQDSNRPGDLIIGSLCIL